MKKIIIYFYFYQFVQMEKRLSMIMKIMKKFRNVILIILIWNKEGEGRSILTVKVKYLLYKDVYRTRL